MWGDAMKKILSCSEKETEEVGISLGENLWAGSFISLIGDLGCGKTVLTRGIARGLGIKGYVTSPTFTIIHEYYGRIPLYHFDVYRINDPDEMYEIGYEEYFYGDGITVVEWPQRIEELLPGNRLEIEVKMGTEPNEREIILTPYSQEYVVFTEEFFKK